MAIIAIDSFTTAIDVAIEAHTPDIGTGWTASTLLDTTDFAATGSVQHSAGANLQTAREGTTVGTDAMIVSADTVMNTNNSGHRSGVVVRYSGADHLNFFSAYVQGNNATTLDVTLIITSGGVASTLASSSITIANNTVARNLKLEASAGSPTTLKVYFANSATAFLTLTDTRLSGNNFGGIYGRNTAPRIDNYLCQTVTGGGATVAAIESSFIFSML